MEEQGEAGSFFGSESAQEQESQHVVEQGGAADSVNYGAQSPRVPRSQISRAHPGQTLGYAERTSAVLSALSGDDETALSAAEAAGEHTSHPQAGVGPVGAGRAAAVAGGAAAGGPLLGPPVQGQALQQGAQPAGASKVEDPLSPPESTSPMYRANSVVSYTAAPLRLPLRRPAETPMSLAPLQGVMMGASPTTSRVERLPYAPPPAVGRPVARPHSAQQARGQLQPPLPGPSTVSHSQATQPASATGGHSLPSTLGLVIGMAPPPPFPPAPQPVASATPNLAAWVGLAASMGVPLEVLQAQGAAALGQQGQHAQTRLQQAEALQSMAAALQAQASVILQQQQHQQQQQQQLLQGQSTGLEQSRVAAVPSADHRHEQAQPEEPQAQQLAQQAQQAPPQEPPPQPQNAVIEASAAGGGVSMYSAPDLVGASVIQGHPLPPPFYAAGAGAAALAGTAPTLVSGVTPPANLLTALQPQPAVAAAGSNQRPGSGNRSSASPTAPAGRDPRLLPSQAPASSMVHGQGQYRPPRAQLGPAQHTPTAAEPAGPAEAAPASAGRQGSARGGEQEAHGMPSTDAAAIGGALGGDDMGGNDGLEVQQEPPGPMAEAGSAEPGAGGGRGATGDDARQGEGGRGLNSPPGSLPPAPHGAASVMATLVSSGEQSDVESEISGMQQQAVSGPHSHPAAAGEVQSPLPSMQPAAATTNAHMSLSLVAATACRPPWPAQQQQQQQHSASGQSPQGQGAAGSRLGTVETGADDDAAGGSVDMTAPASQQQQHQHATSAPLFAVGGESGAAAAGPGPGAGVHPTTSAPTVLPGQPVQPDQPQPAMSVSLSAHGDGAEAPAGHFAEHNPVAPQAQSSAFVFKQQRRHSAWEEHNVSAVPPADQPGAMPMEEDGQQVQDGGGSPRASTFDAPLAASEGTARGTILAGQAHSILTTAAAGDGDHADVGEGEALSPLVLGRAGPQRAAPSGGGAGRQSGQGGVVRFGGAAPHAATNSASLPARSRPQQPPSPATAAGSGPPAVACKPPAEPMDLSTMAQDVGGPAEGGEPEHTLSGQAPTAVGNQQQLQQQQQHCVQSSGEEACVQCTGLGGGAESVYANGDVLSGGALHTEVAQPADGTPGGDHGEVAPHGYASSIILGNGLLAGGSGLLPAVAEAAVAAATTAAGSELTSPSSVSGKRSKRKRGNDD